MQPPVAVSERMDVDEAEGGDGAAHQRRLAAGPLEEDLQPPEHRGQVLLGRCDVVDDLLIPDRFADEDR